jgi:hypothetical protein
MAAGWEIWPQCPECKKEGSICICQCVECGKKDNICACSVGLHAIQGIIPTVCGGPQIGCRNNMCAQCERNGHALLQPGWVKCDSAHEQILKKFGPLFDEKCSSTDYLEYTKTYNGPLCNSEQSVVNHAARHRVLCVTQHTYMPSNVRILQCKTTEWFLVLIADPTTH